VFLNLRLFDILFTWLTNNELLHYP
jgi:hypothetical protein